MSDEKKPEEKAPAAKKSSPIGMILPAILAGAAAFGGAKFAPVRAAQAEPAHAEEKPPGPTMQLEPFLVSIFDAEKRQHAMKMTIAVELDHNTKEEALRTYVPRARDACLSYLRSESFEQVTETEHAEKVRKELVSKLKEAGVAGVERILITDFVVQ